MSIGRTPQFPRASSNPERDAQSAETREALRRALTELPVPQREAVLLRDVEGVSLSRAARILGVTVPALKSRLRRGRCALRQALGEHYADRSPTGMQDDCRAMGRLRAPSRVRRAVRRALVP